MSLITVTYLPSFLLFLLLVFLHFNNLSAIPIDNGVEGDPEIECGPASITVNFNTRNKFEGHVYVKGLYDHDECRTDATERQVAGIELPIDSCNVERSRSLNPTGLFITTVVVITFHPKFITKVDRAYRIQCFYMEANKTVSAQIDVDEITTALQTQIVKMPICRYEILKGGPNGEPIRHAMIGESVYHKWTCDSETADAFCALVHSCVVDDGKGDTVPILNGEGCALDKYLLNNLEYPADLMAGQEAHVYKYADRPELYYQCQISISIKDSNTGCARPQCAEPQGFGSVQSAAAPSPKASAISPDAIRLLKKRSINYDNTMDVNAVLSTIDISEEDFDLSLKNRLPSIIDRSKPLYYEFNGSFCIATHNILLIILFSALLSFLLVLLITYITYCSKN